MSNKKASESASKKVEQEAVEVLSKSEEYIHKNRRTIGIILLAIIVVIGGFLAYRYLYAIPRQENAYEAMYTAEHYFGIDSFQLALEGNNADVQGFLSVIDEYKGTDAANLAQAWAGRCYYHLGQPEVAIDYLKRYKGSDMMVASSNTALIGDCYVALGQYQEAIKYFNDAAKQADNELLSPIFLKKAGLAYEAIGNKENALKSYQTIKDKYYNSPEAQEVDKLIQALSYK